MSNGTVKAPARHAGKKNGKKKSAEPTIPLRPLLGVGLACALLFAAFVAFTGNRPVPPSSSAIGGPFQLTTHEGRAISDKDLLGHPFLVFFGYTHCGDVCPTTLFEMSETLRALGPEAKIGALFVTVDPERDTPPKLKEYLANFDPRILGVSGDHPALDPMLKEYRIYAKRVGEGEDYAVDHTTALYLMDKNGRFVSSFNVSRKPEEAARDLQRYL